MLQLGVFIEGCLFGFDMFLKFLQHIVTRFLFVVVIGGLSRMVHVIHHPLFHTSMYFSQPVNGFA